MALPQTALTESFDGSLRDELLNQKLFDSLADARRKLAVWRYDYNNVRPYSSWGNRTPASANIKPADSCYDCWISGGQVTRPTRPNPLAPPSGPLTLTQ